MQQIERYGVIALVFLLVTIVAVSFWGDSKSPGFWSRLTGRGAKKDIASAQVQPSPEIAPQTVEASAPAAAPTPVAGAPATGERALATELPLSAPSAAATPTTLSASPTADLGTQTAPQTARNEPAPVAPLAASTPPPARPVVRTVQAAPPAGSVEYTVQKGDSLMRIAARALGSKDRWTEIRDLNHGVDPHSLKVGMKISLPASASRTSTETKHVVPVRLPAAKPAPKKETPAAPTDTYLVHKGDTLKSIAERRLGNSARWKEIADANPRLDPHRLIVGAEIRMPKAKSGRGLESKGEPALAVAVPRETSRAMASDRPRVR